MTRALGLLLLLLPFAGCSQVDENVKAAAVNVITLQSGTISELKARRGTGPFRAYELPPDELLSAVEAAARKAIGEGGHPVRAVFVSEPRLEVVAKERGADEASYAGYRTPFRSALVATVHPVVGQPGRSRLELHSMHRGPFHKGRVQWERDMPGWIDEALAERANPPPRIRPIK